MSIFSGSLAFPFLNDSEASTSLPFYASGSSVTQRQTFNSERLDINDNFADWPMSVPAHVGPWSANHGGDQDFLSLNRYGSSFERADINDPFGFTNGNNGNHQLMDTTGIIDELFNDSVRNSHQTLEILGNAEAPVMNLISGYADILYYPNHELPMPCVTGINEPLYFGSSSSDHNDDMLLNDNIELEEHHMKNLSRNFAINYDTLAERPGGVALVGRNFDIESRVSAEGSKAAEESTSGYHGIRMCNMSNKKQLIGVKNEKHVSTPGTACKKEAPANGKSTGTPLSNRRKKGELETNDETSGYQFSSQVNPSV